MSNWTRPGFEPHLRLLSEVPASLPSDFGSLSLLAVKLTPSDVRNLASVAFAPTNWSALAPALAGSMSTTPLPVVMMPELWSALRGRLLEMRPESPEFLDTLRRLVG